MAEFVEDQIIDQKEGYGCRIAAVEEKENGQKTCRSL
jgi:hypothetical protein